jgi:hypothetical protein
MLDPNDRRRELVARSQQVMREIFVSWPAEGSSSSTSFGSAANAR